MISFFAIFVSYLVLSLFVGFFARSIGKDVITYFCLSLLLTPLSGFFITIYKAPEESKPWIIKLQRGLKIIVKYLDAAIALGLHLIMWIIHKLIVLLFLSILVFGFGYSIYLLGVHVFHLLKDGIWANNIVLNHLAGPDKEIYDWKGVVAIFRYADFIVIFIFTSIFAPLLFKWNEGCKGILEAGKDWDCFLND